MTESLPSLYQAAGLIFPFNPIDSLPLSIYRRRWDPMTGSLSLSLAGNLSFPCTGSHPSPALTSFPVGDSDLRSSNLSLFLPNWQHNPEDQNFSLSASPAGRVNWVVSNRVQDIFSLWNRASIKERDGHIWDIAFFVITWFMWLPRNEVTFRGATWDVIQVWEASKLRVVVWDKARWPNKYRAILDTYRDPNLGGSKTTNKIQKSGRVD
ncbi:Uncharacterized protein TCM_004105 [Theobroma cacao]|uniref:Uncharacterized protein n=1 Tax=Theobroma cacao TaxID=3641 RepID=A0A061DQ03_THECC|nr:Uncharacterized protein TCM_004105 [Theobroma cacao]